AYDVTNNSDPNLDNLYLVTLVDDRYWWQFWQWSSGTSAFNSGSTPTWNDLLNAINGGLHQQVLNWPMPINSAYLSPEPDSDLYSNYESMPVLRDASAANIGCVVVNEMDGVNFRLLPGSGDAGGVDSDSRIATNRNGLAPLVRLAGGDMFGNEAVTGPS